MPNLKTVTEVQSAKQKLEQAILNLVKEFELQTGTTVDSILCWGPGQRANEQDRIQVRSTIKSLASAEVIGKAAEVSA